MSVKENVNQETLPHKKFPHPWPWPEVRQQGEVSDVGIRLTKMAS